MTKYRVILKDDWIVYRAPRRPEVEIPQETLRLIQKIQAEQILRARRSRPECS